MLNLLLEAISVGIVVIIFSIIIKIILKYLNIYNDIINYFLIGFFTHLLFEFLGLNKYYCKYGNACKIN